MTHKIAIIGLPGSGKSTFAIKLGKLLQIPVYHLDKHTFDGNTKRPKDKLLEELEEMVNQPSWIIEGCSFSTFEMRFSKADTVIYFHLPRTQCLWNLLKRLFEDERHLNETGCLKGINWPMLKYMWTFDQEKRPRIEELRKKYPHVHFVEFKSSKDSALYIRGGLKL